MSRAALDRSGSTPGDTGGDRDRRHETGEAGAAAGPATPILHGDLDAFFASVEQRDDPRLRGRPVIVGGLGARGVVATASYEARRAGVHSAMAMARARRLCPSAAFLPPDFDRYREASASVFAIYRELTPLVEPLSLDEAFLDLRPAGLAGRVAAARAAAQLRRRVRDEVGLALSVGVGSTKLVAKLASDDAKPDGLLVVEPGSELEWLWQKPVERVWGVGPATTKKLAQLGVHQVGELAQLEPGLLVRRFGRAQGSMLAELARNRDPRVVVNDRSAKSVGAEQTFETDLVSRSELEGQLRQLVSRVARRLAAAELSGRTVTIKVRFANWQTITRSATLSTPVSEEADLYRGALELLESIDPDPGVRLLGVSVSQLATCVQGAFDFAGAGREQDAGRDSASEAESPSERPAAPGLVVWHSTFGRGEITRLSSGNALVRFEDGAVRDLELARAGLRTSRGRLVRN